MFEDKNWDATFKKRLARHYDEMKWLYSELYHNDQQAFDYFCEMMFEYYQKRSPLLKEWDEAREASPDWYKGNDMLGMLMYTNDSDDVVPHPILDSNGWWNDFLAKQYTGGAQVFECPAAGGEHAKRSMKGTNIDPSYASYGLNYNALPYGAGEIKGQRLPSIPRPTETLCTVDSFGDRTAGDNLAAYSNACLGSGVRDIAERHNGQKDCNLQYFDGHVGTMKGAELRTLSSGTGGINKVWDRVGGSGWVSDAGNRY